jgi:PKD repeat protein
MERIATIVLLVASVAALGYLKMEQLDLYASNAEIAAAAAVESAAADAAELVEAAKIRFTIPHDRDVNTTDITVALDGSESFDAEGDSISYSWTQTSGNDVYLRYAEDADGNTTNFRASPGEYTFKLTVSDAYGSSTTGETTVSVAEEPNLPPEVVVKVYETSETIE